MEIGFYEGANRLRVVCGVIFAAALFALAAAASGPSRDDETAFLIQQLPPEIEETFKALQYLLTRSEVEEFLSLNSNYKRHRWIEAFWAGRDPVFTTTENEMLEEHERRVTYAASEFAIPKWPGWDARGEVYIRYGQPAYRHIIPPDVPPNQILPAGELWFYPWHNLAVRFEDAFANGEYTRLLGHVRGPASVRLGGIKPIDADFDSPRSDMPVPPDLEAATQSENFSKMLNNFDAVLEKTPSSYPFDFEWQRLPVYFGVDCFRGGEDVDRVEVNIEFQAFLSDGSDSVKTRSYVASGVFWDKDREEVGREEQTIELPTVKTTRDSVKLVPARLVFTLPPDFYHMAVTVEEKQSRRFSSYRASVTCEDFNQKLAISNILFASKISETTGTSPFNRGALEVVPHPMRSYNHSAAVPIYFEIYNLTAGPGGVSSYAVEYRIVPRTPKKRGFWASLLGWGSPGNISSSFEASCHGPHDSVHIAVRADELWAGDFEFQVKVSDRGSRDEASRKAVFHFVE